MTSTAMSSPLLERSPLATPAATKRPLGKGGVRRVLLVSPVGELGGAEQVFLSLSRHLPKYGIEPVVACMRPGPLIDMFRLRGVSTHQFRPHRYRNVWAVGSGVRWLCNIARRERVELLHCNHSAHVYASPAAKRYGIPEVWHLHDFPFRTGWFERLSVMLPTDHAIFTTHKVRSGYPRLGRGPCSIIAPALLESCEARPAGDEADLRRRFNLPSAPMLLTVARLQEHKGHRDLLSAIPLVLREAPDACFVFVGKASTPDEERYSHDLHARCATLGISDRVRFLGYVSDQDLAVLYRVATALVHPARTEGFGLILLEAMAAGLPVVATDADGPKEIIVPGKNGLLVRVGDHTAMANEILRVLQESTLRAALIEGGRKSAERYQVDAMVESVVAVYNRLAITTSRTGMA